MRISLIPLSLYIHIPWCIKKCPYCDFNSHALQGELPEKEYINQLIKDLKTQLPYVQNRPIHSIFIGGGTPSLFSGAAFTELFSQIKEYLSFKDKIEITLEANPGTLIPHQFESYLKAGINRISFGVQSFQNEKLKTLGRIHNNDQAKIAVMTAQKEGFQNINIDLMFGLPNQTIDDALFDLQSAIDLSPTHLSWYQLTLEPNTYFYRFPPILPSDDERFDIQERGQKFLQKNDFIQYEISAYAKNKNYSQHNLNYWLFGDYLGIGAGAHAKLTDFNSGEIIRRMSVKHPKQFLNESSENISELKTISKKELPLEFMMNALRLRQSIPITLFENRTGLSFTIIKKLMQKAVNADFLQFSTKEFQVTEKGYLFLNDLLEMFVREA